MEDLEHIDYLYQNHPLNETYSSGNILVVKLTMRGTHSSRRYAFFRVEPRMASQPHTDRNTSITIDPAQIKNNDGSIFNITYPLT